MEQGLPKRVVVNIFFRIISCLATRKTQGTKLYKNGQESFFIRLNFCKKSTLKTYVKHSFNPSFKSSVFR